MNDILNAPLWQKIVAAVAIVGLLLWGYYNWLYTPKVREINRLKSTLRTVEQEIRAIIPPGTRPDDEVAIKELIRKEVDELMKKIPTEQEVPFIIDELISRVGQGLNINYNTIKPQALVPEDKYKRLPLNVGFGTDYTDLNLYMKELKNLPATVRIDSLSLTRTSAPPRLAVDMSLSIFILPGVPSIKKDELVQGRKPYLFDPFFKLVEGIDDGKNKQKAPLELQGIWRGKETRAIVNNTALLVGESISGYELIEIGSDQATLIKNNNRFIIKLGGGK